MSGGMNFGNMFKRLVDPLGLFTKDDKPADAATPQSSGAAPGDPNNAAAAAERDAKAEEERRRAAGGGRASTYLMGLGDDTGNSASRKLLG